MAVMSQKTRILLLDDDVFHRGLLAEGLEDYYDFVVTRVESLARAESEIEKVKPDLLLLDIVLGENRLEVIEWVKRLRRGSPYEQTPVLFVTAFYGEMEEQVRGIERAAILAKPFNFEDVTQEMKRLLGKSKQS
jgi:two-component system, NtrC family, nitrogen regulation response regulator NtrX